MKLRLGCRCSCIMQTLQPPFLFPQASVVYSLLHIYLSYQPVGTLIVRVNLKKREAAPVGSSM